MPEYIERDKLGICKCNPEVFEDKGYAKGWNAAIDIIQNAPAADVRPVVFCRDCKHAHMTHDGLCKYCDMMAERGEDDALYLPGDWFCADGEKREES